MDQGGTVSEKIELEKLTIRPAARSKWQTGRPLAGWLGTVGPTTLRFSRTANHRESGFSEESRRRHGSRISEQKEVQLRTGMCGGKQLHS
jgi:hypothetical protein